MQKIGFLSPMCLVLIALVGCTNLNSDIVGSIAYMELQDSISPVPQEGMPRCAFRASIAYFDSSKETAKMLNAQIANCLLLATDNTMHTSPKEAVENFRNGFFQLYTDEIAPLVQVDSDSGVPVAEMPEWYNVARELETWLFCGRDSVVCYELRITDHRGGVHPNTYTFWYDFSLRDASRITVGDCLDTDAEGLTTLLEEELVRVINGKTDDDIADMEALKKEYGIPYGDSLYVPENFLLTESCVSFLYNRYEIAPYAFGDIRLDIPYDKIRPYLKRNNRQ
ncbi:MAG: RsiV family protein [Bacteroidales bacterium]|nr:RsiV family protein [Bacteroidales bacterium]